MRHSTSANWELARLGLLLVTLTVFASGCMSEQAESDWRWQQQNPYWKPTAPPDGRPQWGPFAPP